MVTVQTRPCDYCGLSVTKTAAQQSQRKYWTCDRSCANKLRIQLGNTPAWKENPLRGQRQTRPCANPACSNLVTRYLSQVNERQEWACSRSCRATLNLPKLLATGKWKPGQKPRRGETNPCEVCGTPVYRNKSQAAKGVSRFCSVACRNIAQAKEAVVKPCARCGKEMRLKPSQAHIQHCSRACMGAAKTKRPGDRIFNDRPIRYDAHGYVMVWQPDHPNKSQKGWQYEHRLIVEATLGRLLRSDEHVHHLNGDKDDNRPENLEVMDGVEHAVLSGREYRDGVQAKLDKLAEYERRFGPLD